MGTTPTGEASLPSPFADGELYDVLIGGLDYGVDFYVGLAREAGGRCWTSPAARGGC